MARRFGRGGAEVRAGRRRGSRGVCAGFPQGSRGPGGGFGRDDAVLGASRVPTIPGAPGFAQAFGYRAAPATSIGWSTLIFGTVGAVVARGSVRRRTGTPTRTSRAPGARPPRAGDIPHGPVSRATGRAVHRNQAPGLRSSDHQRAAHRDSRVFAIPEQAPAVAEQPVAVSVKEFRERIG